MIERRAITTKATTEHQGKKQKNFVILCARLPSRSTPAAERRGRKAGLW